MGEGGKEISLPAQFGLVRATGGGYGLPQYVALARSPSSSSTLELLANASPCLEGLDTLVEACYLASFLRQYASLSYAA